MSSKIKTSATAFWTYLLDAILGPITRATIVILDRDALLIQPTHSLLRTSSRSAQSVNHIAGYPRYL